MIGPPGNSPVLERVMNALSSLSAGTSRFPSPSPSPKRELFGLKIGKFGVSLSTDAPLDADQSAAGPLRPVAAVQKTPERSSEAPADSRTILRRAGFSEALDAQIVARLALDQAAETPLMLPEPAPKPENTPAWRTRLAAAAYRDAEQAPLLTALRPGASIGRG